MSQLSTRSSLGPTWQLLRRTARKGSVTSSFVGAFTLCSVLHAQSATPSATPPAHSDQPSAPSSAPAAAPTANESALPAPAAEPGTPPTNASKPAPCNPAVVTAAETTPDASSSDSHAGPHTREGFYLRIASGPSFMSLSGDAPTGSASLTGLGNGVMLSLGGRVAPGLILAGTFQESTMDAKFSGGPFANATVSSGGTSTPASHSAAASSGLLGMLIDWYPTSASGWHTGASAGLGFASVLSHADDSAIAGASFAGSLFGGYDWSIAHDWSIGLQMVATGATPATMKHTSGGADAGYELTPVSVGLQCSVLYF